MTLKDKWVIPNRLLPLNSRARFSLIKTIGYNRHQQVCNSFVNQLTHIVQVIT